MSEKKNVDLNIVDLVSVAASLTDKLFIKAKKEDAKQTFKELKKGNSIHLGKITIENTLNPALKLYLDYSEFRGPGFNFDLFSQALSGILLQIGQKFQAKADLNVMRSDDGGAFLIHLPGMIKTNGQLNAMVMSFDLRNKNNFFVDLMFIDPTQYTNNDSTENQNTPTQI